MGPDSGWHVCLVAVEVTVGGSVESPAVGRSIFDGPHWFADGRAGGAMGVRWLGAGG
ncbi:hypothetical protein [Thermogemmatispora carboxidivorans]|uniref:hypothetical protein n=1 Tax=Thermogemmatispora carboxidivorans TaxID=1382306 RepID=UPI0012DEE702|nr:hypothetical protein [Thermogemmatispora carboxidivorans]